MMISRSSVVDWEKAIEIATITDSVDLPTQALLLGMGESAILTRLGTFANRFWNDQGQAQALWCGVETRTT
jgi:hypothetical protein